MRHHIARNAAFVFILFIWALGEAHGGIIVFHEKDFPSTENGAMKRTSLERAFSGLGARFVSLSELQKESVLSKGDVLVLAHGSAFPADAWVTIHRHLERGNLLVLGGRPFFVPVYHTKEGWKSEYPQNTFARHLGILHSYPAPRQAPWHLEWEEDISGFAHIGLDPRTVYVNAGYGGRYRGLGFLVNARGDRLAAPIVAEDLVDRGLPPRRRVYLSFDADPLFWDSPEGIDLIRRAARYASYGGVRLWLDLQQLALDPGASVAGAVDVVRGGPPGKLAVELLSGTTVLASRTTLCDTILHEDINLRYPLINPGLYKVRLTLSVGDSAIECYTSGVYVRDSTLLRSGSRLQAGRDYFRLDGRPYLMVGTNYFSTDPYTSAFFVGGSLGGNAWQWERDFAEMERQGFTAVRTGIWLNRMHYLDPVSGAVNHRLLHALEAYLLTAARHHLQVVFTFFAFDPQTELQKGPGQEKDRLGPGSNPYLDPVAVEAQVAYVRAIVSRFRDVPFLSFDLINEPSFANPGRLWKGNSPNGDPIELRAWQQWLEKRYGTIDRLAKAWRVPSGELGSFDRVPVPAFTDLEPSRTGNPRVVRAVDYNLFAQDAFRQWVDIIIQTIRSTGARQVITVGQDEGGVADRVLNQFWGSSGVDYTVNHSWWRDDALLWNSVAAKTPGKPNLIGETGLQPVWSMDGSWRWDEVQGMPLLERKLVLGFANATAGVLYWDWTHSDTYGLLRRDGSHKEWMNLLRGIAAFARDAGQYAVDAKLPEVALILPQSLQLSAQNKWGIAVQQRAVRALYHHARGTAFVTGEYQLSRMPAAKLIIVPAPSIFQEEAWQHLMAKVRAGATVLISGRIDADEHWTPVPERLKEWNIGYTWAPLAGREAVVHFPDDSLRLSYSDDITTYAERGVLDGDRTFLEIPLGSGRILYSPLPLELADQLDVIGRVYKFAMDRAGVGEAYETSCEDPGILISPTRLPEATLYVLTSESSTATSVRFRDRLSGAKLQVGLEAGRGAMILVDKGGRTLASYNAP